MSADLRERAPWSDAALPDLTPMDRRVVGAFLRTQEESLPALVKREVRTKLETGRKTP